MTTKETRDEQEFTRRQIILNVVSDLVSCFLYYDRKEDEDLPRGEIEAAIVAGEISIDEIVRAFEEELREGLDIDDE